MNRFFFIFLLVPVWGIAHEDLYDRDQSQSDFNPYDYPEDYEPDNTNSRFYVYPDQL